MRTYPLNFCFGIQISMNNTGHISSFSSDMNVKYTVYHMKLNCSPKYYNMVLWI